ncbi:L,D-transpeptidase family protein [Spiribacter vilamensis]|nr:L,D-transpeptidase family protein [Spiribacter vilamensis]
MAPAASAPRGDIWVRVDTETAVTEVWRGNERLLELDDIAFGRGGISDLHLRGDQTTPRGEYRITHFNPQSRFHRFIGINYPTLDHLDRARRRGDLSDRRYRMTLEKGLRDGRFPQDGVLGGHIGFHGIGDGDPDIHQAFHWTKGCIAMTNEQIETLQSLVDVGTPVVIE